MSAAAFLPLCEYSDLDRCYLRSQCEVTGCGYLVGRLKGDWRVPRTKARSQAPGPAVTGGIREEET